MISLGYRLSPDFNWRERGNIVQQVKRGKSYSAVARFWSRKKRKAISWTTIRAICERAGVKTSFAPSLHKSSLNTSQEKPITNQEKPGFLSRIFNNLFG